MMPPLLSCAPFLFPLPSSLICNIPSVIFIKVDMVIDYFQKNFIYVDNRSSVCKLNRNLYSHLKRGVFQLHAELEMYVSLYLSTAENIVKSLKLLLKE